MHTPRRRWTDFPAGLRRVRISAGLTQSDLAEMLSVDQATISRWERGAQMPDAETQNRLRDMLFRGRAISDARLAHLVRSATGLMALVAADGSFVALSDAGRAFAAGGEQSIHALMTPSLQRAWDMAVAAGFFRGELASVRLVAEMARPGGGGSIPVVCGWHPATLADGTVLMLAEGREIDAATYEAQRAEPVRITPLEEIL